MKTQFFPNFPRLLNGQKMNAGTELQILIKLLTDQFHPDKIICFARVMTNMSSESCFAPELIDPYCHYFLLVTTKETCRREHEIQDFVNTHFKEGGATVLSHSIAGVREAIGKQSRFFSTVLHTGTVLYSADGILQVELPGQIDPAETVAKAEKHFDYRFTLSRGFLESAEERFKHGSFNLCAFMLHQAVEQSCVTMIRVFMGYRSDIHHLGRLLTLCLCFSEKPDAVFPRHNQEEEYLFQVLLRSYSEARYKEDFKVKEEDAKLLYARVRKFLNMAEKLCVEKIAEYKASIEVADLPEIA